MGLVTLANSLHYFLLNITRYFKRILKLCGEEKGRQEKKEREGGREGGMQGWREK